APSQGDAATLETLLGGGADANEQLPLGRKPLMLAARSGRVEAVRILLEHGADPNASEIERGTTALMQAADQGHADVMAVLIEHGADIAERTLPVFRDGRTAALGQSEDPRRSVRRQVISVMCDLNTQDIATLRDLALTGGDNALITDATAELTVATICERLGGGGFFNGGNSDEE